ncbi:DUF3861 domain-containing protein [Shewanella olleyana]|uniref:DUF3861 domain-containing protein n=1 Tax=Shewanella olleyana TaxID=135626 RepID=UPI00200BAC92|nr:DUF3861 domain-containing protein [Shewanella olleyana]MCL1065315.1 DUF3861 domain-containing protein [Shewanella olleyana]
MNTIIRKGHSYRITVEEINLPEQQTGKTLDFELQDREDLFNVVDNLQKGSGLEPSLATKVAVALRLLGPVMMENRKHPLFVEFMPHFKSFMQNLKSTVKSTLNK